MDDLISRKAAIKAIEDLQDCYNGFSDTYDKACIIGVLEEVPSAQPDLQPTCNQLATDCISRQAAIDAIHRDANPFLEYAASQIESLPTIEIVRCRECKHHDGIRCFRWNSTIITGFDDFCSNGERRDDNE